MIIAAVLAKHFYHIELPLFDTVQHGKNTALHDAILLYYSMVTLWDPTNFTRRIVHVKYTSWWKD